MHRLIALIAAIMVAAAGMADAASPEQTYLAARDGFIAKFKVDTITDALSKDEDNARADLEKQMRVIIGPVAIAGVDGPGKLNLDTLFSGDEGFGMLDGLVFASAGGKTSVIVTTDTLFASWLRGHKTWWGDKDAPMPQDAAAALRTEAFYTQAISTDSAVVHYGELPLRKPDGAKLALAVLAARTQSDAPAAPDQIFVALIKGDRVFVANVPLAEAITAPAACVALRADYAKRAQAAFEGYSAGGHKAQKLFDRYTKLQQDGDRAFRKCFAEKTAKDQLAKAAQQAQALAEAMASAK